LEDFAKLLAQAQCPLEHTSYQGSMRFSAGDTSDEIQVDLLWHGCMYG
jgi:hypothetical protein